MGIKSVTRSNTQYFIPIQIFLTFFVAGYLIFSSVDAVWYLVGLGGYFATGCLGITVTFHRFLSHRSFKMHKLFEYSFSYLGAMGGTGSSIGWVSIHRQHHAHSDLPGDPHSPGLMGWKVFFPKYIFEMNKWSIRDLITNPFHLFIHEYYFAVLAFWGLSLFIFFGLKGFVFIFATPIVLQVWISVLSNYVNHSQSLGYKNFSTEDDSVNSWWMAILTWGEGWHNNHHQHPGYYSFQKFWWELDPSSWVIKLIKSN